jgi:hypothetical protein
MPRGARSLEPLYALMRYWATIATMSNKYDKDRIAMFDDGRMRGAVSVSYLSADHSFARRVSQPRCNLLLGFPEHREHLRSKLSG